MTLTATIIIVNYRTSDLVVDCLRSLEPEVSHVSGRHVVVVDNASGDGSTERIRAAIHDHAWQSWITVVESPRNGGFSAGNNIGIGARCSQLYILLNPDTVATPGSIDALIGFMHMHPRAGIVGSRLEDPDGTMHVTARRRPSPLSELDAAAQTGLVTRLLSRWCVRMDSQCAVDSGAPVKCDWVSGAAMCVRREVFDEAGLLDEGYFLYFEEVDLCDRARRAANRSDGWEVWYLPQSRIVHVEGASTGISDPNRTRPAYWYASRRRFFLKHHGVVGLICADVLWAMGRMVFGVRQAVGLAGRAIDMPRAAARELLWGDAKSLLSGDAFRIARES